MTQGRTRAEALEMIGDWLETMIDRPGFRAEVHPRGKNEFEISGNDVAALTALLLRRRRQASGASLREVAARLGASSRNAYARYERGDVVPTVEKLDALLKAPSPDGDVVIRDAINLFVLFSHAHPIGTRPIQDLDVWFVRRAFRFLGRHQPLKNVILAGYELVGEIAN
jgi:transcriptional regulator with XRE-family HTH domain